MAGYLDHYGAGEEKRERIIKTALLSLVALVVAGGILFFIFHNYSQERAVTRFFERLQAHDYQGAYNMWVKTAEDRHNYPFQSFLRDWGPQGDHPDVSNFRIVKSRSCGSGVILTVDFGKKKEEEKLWVQRNDTTIGFSPLPGCPAPR
ncbi:MAG TPA: hypothetical protein VKX45_18710 [Bryobacteraceae bacterium]|jgi:hypothetical protein|nr:hypothetical protein [Bryobacteraceae bacterium]